jgi:hypothetical protein
MRSAGVNVCQGWRGVLVVEVNAIMKVNAVIFLQK